MSSRPSWAQRTISTENVLPFVRETRDKRRGRIHGLNNFFNITLNCLKLDEGIIFFEDKVLFNGRQCSRSLISLFQLFSHRQIPLTTTDFVGSQFVGNSLIVDIIHRTPKP